MLALALLRGPLTLGFATSEPFWIWKVPVDVNAPTELLKYPSARSVSSPGNPRAPAWAHPFHTPASDGKSVGWMGTTAPCGCVEAHPDATSSATSSRNP